MARYIDADKIECIKAPIAPLKKDDAISWEDIAFKSDIDNIPTADVQEVKHGKWVYHYRLKKFVCLECGYETKHKPDFNYCGKCGAKMDKE